MNMQLLKFDGIALFGWFRIPAKLNTLSMAAELFKGVLVRVNNFLTSGKEWSISTTVLVFSRYLRASAVAVLPSWSFDGVAKMRKSSWSWTSSSRSWSATEFSNFDISSKNICLAFPLNASFVIQRSLYFGFVTAATIASRDDSWKFRWDSNLFWNRSKIFGMIAFIVPRAGLLVILEIFSTIVVNVGRSWP